MADNGKTIKDMFDTFNEEQKNVVYFLIDQALEQSKSGKSDDEEDDDCTIQDVFDTFNEEQKNVVYFLIGQALRSTNRT